MNIAMGLLQHDDVYLLQLRNGKKQAGGLNLIGCFGGKIEPGETALQAACREVTEESSYAPTTQQAELLGEVNVNSDWKDQTITVHATVYLFQVPPQTKVTAHEGELVTMSLGEIRRSLDKFTPGTRACFEQLVKE